jgi:hypothetical protein
MTTAKDHIANTLKRAQHCWDEVLDPKAPDNSAVNLLIYHVTTAVLLEHVRRLDPDLADQLVPWLMGKDGGIFADGYAVELLYQWRQQVAAGEPMGPIGPPPADGEKD